jgi:mono/diheme cytochrome c family protein
MVPNLRAIAQETNAEYWRNWVTQGKAGTLMPAFSEKHGGILNDAQIDSLVKYLSTTIPPRSQVHLVRPLPVAQ